MVDELRNPFRTVRDRTHRSRRLEAPALSLDQGQALKAVRIRQPRKVRQVGGVNHRLALVQHRRLHLADDQVFTSPQTPPFSGTIAPSTLKNCLAGRGGAAGNSR